MTGSKACASFPVAERMVQRGMEDILMWAYDFDALNTYAKSSVDMIRRCMVAM
jgi:hypothetical protein